MKHNYIIFFLVLILLSCKESDKQKISRLVNKWDGKQIIYPHNIKFNIFGQDTTFVYNNSKFSIVTYIDSTGCTSCKLKLPEWKTFIAELESKSKIKIPILFFLCTRNVKEMQRILKRNNFNYPVCIDSLDNFNNLNHLPAEKTLQTFLLNQNREVVFIGNPIYNPKIKNLYFKIISEGKVSNEHTHAKTKVDLSNNKLDIGTFDWEKEQKFTFTLQNAGINLLFIDYVSTSCGCISVEYTKEPASPRKSIEIEVTYKADHPEHIEKTITVYCNVASSPLQLKIMGNAK